MRTTVSVFLTLILAVVLTSDAAAQSAKKAPADKDRLSELSPRAHTYRTLLDRAETPQARRQIESYLATIDMRKQDHSAGVKRSGPSYTPTAKTADLSEISPVQGLSDDWGYYGHSTVPVPGGDVLVFFWQEGLRITTRFNDGSWATPTTLVADTWDNPIRAARTGSNRVVVASPSESGIRIAYSDDVFSVSQATATWQTTSLAGTNFYGHDMKPTPDGGLAMTYGQFSASLDRMIYYMRKSTDGVTWSTPRVVLQEGDEFSIFDGSFVAVSSTDYLFVFVEAAPDGLHLTQVSSSNGGISWSTPERILTNPQGLSPLPTLAHASDGTTWLVYANVDDLWFMTSTDGGTSWGSPERWTQYAGDDFYPSISVLEGVSTPFVTFTSQRTFTSDRIWISSLVPGADANPNYLPPVVDFETIQFEIPHSEPLDVRFWAQDETGVTGVNVYYEVDGTTLGPIVAMDDGNSGDGAAGDGIWGATIPGQPLGTIFTYHATATDTDGLTDTTWSWEVRTVAFQNVGRIKAGMPGGRLGAITWPYDSPDNYLYSGGLWLGAGNAVIEHWMWESDPSVEQSDGPGESNQDIVLGVDEPDWLGPDEMVGARVVQRSYQWGLVSGKPAGEVTGRENGLVIEYEVINKDDTAIPELFVGLFLDVDILNEFWDDLIAYESSLGMLYMFDSGDECTANPEIVCPPGYLGMAVLSDGAPGKSMGAVTPYTAGWPQGNGPFAIMTAGINPTLASGVPVDPSDYQMVLTAQPVALGPFESKKVAFAVVMGEGPGELATNLQAIETAYQTFVVSVDEPVDSTVPTEFALSQNYPNPFNPSTNISFSIPTAENVELKIFNVLGEHVETLVSGTLAAGNYEATWNATNVASGLYFYRLDAGHSFAATKSLVVLK
jgi:hypothetical protein